MGDICESIQHVAMGLMKVLGGGHAQVASLAAVKGIYDVQRSVAQQEKLYDYACLHFWGACFCTHSGSQEDLPRGSSYLQVKEQMQANLLYLWIHLPQVKVLEIYVHHGHGDGGGDGDGGGGRDGDAGKVQAQELGKNGHNGDVDGGGGREVEAKVRERGMVSHHCHGGSVVI